MLISPEIVAEQVMGYVVGASELIPTLKPVAKNSYSVAILPQGPHFYTGLLQAAGYLLLDSKKKLLIVSQQSELLDTILIDNNTYGPIFGQTWKISINKIKKIAHDIGGKIEDSQQKPLSEQMNYQLPFISVITENKEVLHISIGAKITKTKLQKAYTWIKNHEEEYTIIFLTNIELTQPAKSAKTDEQNKIAKVIQTPSENTPLLNIFQKIVNFKKKKPEIIAYVNPGDFGKPTSLTIRYICAVA